MRGGRSQTREHLERNKLSLGLFGANCSGGLAVTTVPERWNASWENNQKLACMADAAGIEFMLPLGRWKGYGGITDHNGSNFETLTWATGILASTQNIMAFGTVHVSLFNPVVAAKQMVSADHVGQGRFGLNIVCGWNSDEFGSDWVAPYSASKGGVVQLTKSLAVAWAQDHIQVNAILPGWFMTELTEAIPQRDPARYDLINRRIPTGRWGEPEELQGAAVFLASRASDYVTGAVITVDGGYSVA